MELGAAANLLVGGIMLSLIALSAFVIALWENNKAASWVCFFILAGTLTMVFIGCVQAGYGNPAEEDSFSEYAVFTVLHEKEVGSKWYLTLLHESSGEVYLVCRDDPLPEGMTRFQVFKPKLELVLRSLTAEEVPIMAP